MHGGAAGPPTSPFISGAEAQTVRTGGVGGFHVCTSCSVLVVAGGPHCSLNESASSDFGDSKGKKKHTPSLALFGFISLSLEQTLEALGERRAVSGHFHSLIVEHCQVIINIDK